MDLLWPWFLVLLGLIPLIILVYLWMLRRRRRFALRFSSLSIVREALPHQSRLRRHLPFALFLLALTSLIVALTRPAFVTSIPTNQTTIILTMDVSGSMRLGDIRPSRLEAAEAAALSFIQHQKVTTQIGIVAFSGFAEEIQPPTTDQQELEAAVESLTTGRRTAIGSGILKALDSIAEIDKNVAPSISDPNSGAVEPTPVPHGDYAPDIIVLLTDGVSNSGPLPLDAAQQAVDRGVRVYTIGFGLAAGDNGIDGPAPQQPQGGGGLFGRGNGFFGFGGGGQGGFRTGLDDTVLKQIATMTGGTYHPASNASQLESVFNSLPTYLISKHQVFEVSVVFAAVGALLAAAAIILSLLWHPLP